MSLEEHILLGALALRFSNTEDLTRDSSGECLFRPLALALIYREVLIPDP